MNYSFPLPKPFTGTVVIEVPELSERFRISSHLFQSGGEIKWETYTDFIEGLHKYIPQFDVQVGERRFTDIHEVSCFHDGAKVMQDIAWIVINGVPIKDNKPAISLVKE